MFGCNEKYIILSHTEWLILSSCYAQEKVHPFLHKPLWRYYVTFIMVRYSMAKKQGAGHVKMVDLDSNSLTSCWFYKTPRPYKVKIISNWTASNHVGFLKCWCLVWDISLWPCYVKLRRWTWKVRLTLPCDRFMKWIWRCKFWMIRIDRLKTWRTLQWWIISCLI